MVLKAVLAQGNKEQNQSYPPHVFQSHFNLVTQYLLDEIAALYPTSNKLIEIADPFIREVQLPVSSGSVKLPADLRNLLGISIYVSPDFKNPCGSDDDTDCEENCDLPDDPLAPTVEQLKARVEKGKCSSQAVNLVDQVEFDNRTKHAYKKPTLKKPMGCRLKTGEVKICPNDVPNVVVRYICNVPDYVYGYNLNQDDTYVFDINQSKESQWSINSFPQLVKGCAALYSIYTRDTELKDAQLELRKVGMF